ncbi:MAG: hypothetical protein RMJ36_06025 [Candidatus Calescibacterium sp.]|nr:hypothetical protein [Candidatus Calescibacterium sp.]MDW8133194.1 hypothetical protein [Candidatus Calescibacterium sp.]
MVKKKNTIIVLGLFFIFFIFNFSSCDFVNDYREPLGKISNNFGTQLKRDIDMDGDNDSAVILNRVVVNSIDYCAFDTYLDSEANIYLLDYNWKNGYFNLVVRKINKDGKLDTNFGSNGEALFSNPQYFNDHYQPYSVYISKNKKVYVLGLIYDNHILLVRLNQDGSIDKNFGQNGSVLIDDKKFDKNYKIFIGSDKNENIFILSSILSKDMLKVDEIILSLDSTGRLNRDFGSNAVFSLYDAIKTDDYVINNFFVTDEGKLYIVGSLNNSENSDLLVIRITNQGNIDNTFSEDGFVIKDGITEKNRDEEGISIVADNKDRLYVTGLAQNDDDVTLFVARFNNDGSLDKSFADNGYMISNRVFENVKMYYGNSIFVDENYNIYVAGAAEDVERQNVLVLKLKSDGNPDEQFGNNGYISISIRNGYNSYGNLVFADNNNIYVIANTFNESNNRNVFIYKFDHKGNSISSFGKNGYISILGMNSNWDCESDFYFIEQLDYVYFHKNRIYLCGYAYNGYNNDIVLVKLDGFGNIVKEFGKNGKVVIDQIIVGNRDEIVDYVHFDESGNIYILGQSFSEYNSSFFLLKLNSNGETDKNFGKEGKFVINTNKVKYFFNSLYVDKNQDIYLVGYVEELENRDMVVMKLDQNGKLNGDFSDNGYIKMNFGSQDSATSVCVDDDGNIFVTGSVYNNIREDYDLIVAKIDRNGGLDKDFGQSFGQKGYIILHNICGGEFGDWGISINATPNKEIYVLANSQDSNKRNQSVVIKMDSNGNLDKNFGTEGVSIIQVESGSLPSSMIVDRNGKIYVLGEICNNGYSPLFLVRLNQNGKIDKTFSNNGYFICGNIFGKNSSIDSGRINIASDGKIYVTGLVYNFILSSSILMKIE